MESNICKCILQALRKTIFLLPFLTVMAFKSKANNVTISDVKVVNNGNGDVKISFDLSWDNSWRVNTGQNNYDGVWVFFKYRSDRTDGLWYQLQLSGTGNSSDPGYSIYQRPLPYQIPAPYVGAMIYRNTLGTGTSSFNDIQLGVYPGGMPYNVDIKAFAIEMVYIPPVSEVLLGDGNGTFESTNAFHYSGQDNRFAWAYYVAGFPLVGTKTDANTFDDDYLNWENGKQLFITDSGYSYIDNGNARVKTWPTGQALWCMKYEISQGGYRDFLNTLTKQQQTNRTEAIVTSARGTLAMSTNNPVRTVIKIDTPSVSGKPAVYGCDGNGNGIYNEVGDGEYIACNYLSWPDVAAYLAWAGLSPLTEVEYERICWGHTDAGLNNPVYGGYAWGNNQISNTPYTISNGYMNNEIVGNISSTPTLGNANYNATTPKNLFSNGMPLRDGIFAAYTGGVTRAISGAAFFGVMEMSGNLSEPCVTIGNSAGRLFAGSIGEGAITADGNAKTYGYDWPGSFPSNDAVELCYSCEVTNSNGTILRGGNFTSKAAELRVSDRSQGQAAATRKPTQGGRGALYVQ